MNPDICLSQYDPIACTPQATCTTGAALLKDEASMHWPSARHPLQQRWNRAPRARRTPPTRRILGWQPTHPGLLADFDHGDYFSPL